MSSDDTGAISERERRAASRLKELLDGAERGLKTKLGRGLIEDGYESGDQLARKYIRGEIRFSKSAQRLMARHIRELGVAKIPDDYFERLEQPVTNGSDGGAPSIRHASLARVLSGHSYRPQTVAHLLGHDQALDMLDDPGEQAWRDLGSVIESMYAAADARRGPAKPPSRGPSRRR